jgi:uncharacterized protein (DUF1684 family)
MHRSSLSRAGIVAAILAAGCSTPDVPPLEPPPMTPEAHAAQAQAWRDKHEVDYRRDWVSIAALHMLEPGTRTVGSDASNAIVIPHLPATAGRLTVDGGRVEFVPAADVAVLQRGEPVSGPVVMRPAGGGATPEVVIGDVRLVVHESGDRLSLRVRDPNGDLARGFLGFSWFPIDQRYRVLARWIPDATPKRMKVLNTFGDLDEYATEGVAEFTLNGETVRLRPFTTRPKRLYFVFRDASAGQETYKVARFLYADLRDDGTAILDFNEAYNPPCAFNPYTTCPVPLPENRPAVKILAGEKAYPVDVPPPAGLRAGGQ